MEAFAPAGKSIEQMVGLDGLRLHHMGVVVIRNGLLVLPDEWADTYPIEGDKLTVCVVPQGGDSGTNPIALIAVIALSVVAPFVAGALVGSIGLTGTIATLVTGGISAAIVAGGAALVNRFVGAPQPKLSQASQRQETFGISGIQNSAPQRTQSVLSLLGTRRIYPFFAALPYTEVNGGEQFLHVLFDMGYGPLEITDNDLLRIGDRQLTNFTDVTWSFHGGTPGTDSGLAQFPSQHRETSINASLTNADSWHELTTAANSDSLVLTIAFRGGLSQISSTGTVIPSTVQVEYQVYADAVDAWGVSRFQSFTGPGTIAPYLGSLEIVFFARGTYRVRIRRTTADPTDPQIRNESILFSSDSVRDDPPVTAQGRSLFAMRIKATGQLSGVVSTFSGVFSRLVSKYANGAWGAAEATNNPAWAFASILRGPGQFQPVPDSDIDGDALEEWANYCDTRGYTFNGVFDSRESVWNALSDVAACGRATPTIKDGNIYSVIVDRVQTVPVDLITPRDSSNFRGIKRFATVPHGITAVYLDGADDSYAPKEVTVYDEGYTVTNATDVRRLELFGTTNLPETHKRVRYQIAESRLRPEEFEVTMDVKNLAVTRGDPVDLIHDVPLIGLGQGRVNQVYIQGGQWIGFDLDADVELGRQGRATTCDFRRRASMANHCWPRFAGAMRLRP